MAIGYKHLTKEARKQASCLAENIYFEAGHESDEGKLAVAMVTLNRVASPNFPDTICEVVHQRVNGVCQFSWLCDQSFLMRRSSAVKTQLYEDIREIAIFAMMNYETIDDMTKGAMYYHANYVHPPWKLNVTARIGNHIFYKRSKDLKWKKEYKV
jgi:spore germination cell wall hydrolase CwlJ-like protein